MNSGELGISGAEDFVPGNESDCGIFEQQFLTDKYFNSDFYGSTAPIAQYHQLNNGGVYIVFGLPGLNGANPASASQTGIFQLDDAAPNEPTDSDNNPDVGSLALIIIYLQYHPSTSVSGVYGAGGGEDDRLGNESHCGIFSQECTVLANTSGTVLYSSVH